MLNRNFGRQIGVRRTGKFQPKQTNSQIKREQRMQKRAVQAARIHGDVPVWEKRMLRRFADFAVLALSAISHRRRH